MRDRNSDLWKPRNPLTQQKHRREVMWQITIPVIVGTVIMLVVCGLAAALSSPLASRWADISIIWLIPPAFLVTLLFMVINAAGVYLLIKLIAAAPPFFYKAQNFFRRIQIRIGSISDKIVEPVLKVNGWSASARAATREARRVFKRN